MVTIHVYCIMTEFFKQFSTPTQKQHTCNFLATVLFVQTLEYIKKKKAQKLGNNMAMLAQHITIFNLLSTHTLGALTHISLASFLWDIGKQRRPRPDTA